MITIGSGRRREPGGFVEHLLDCHARIRRFSELARTLAHARDASLAQVEGAARGVRRYFEEALPLHAEDEEETVLPRLLGRDPFVDAALHRMREEHAAHTPWLVRLIDACRDLESSGEGLGATRDELRCVTESLVPALEVHLEQEERIVFPAIAELIAHHPTAEGEMLTELRARRTAAFARQSSAK